MKNRTIALVTAAFMIGVLFTSCKKKYENDDTIELTSRTSRVANTWIFGYAEKDGENVSSDYEKYELFMNTAGEAQLDAKFTLFGTEYTTATKGTWAFRNNDQEIVLDFEDDEQDGAYEILRLNNDELWLKNMDSFVEIHLLEK